MKVILLFVCVAMVAASGPPLYNAPKDLPLVRQKANWFGPDISLNAANILTFKGKFDEYFVVFNTGEYAVYSYYLKKGGDGQTYVEFHFDRFKDGKYVNTEKKDYLLNVVSFSQVSRYFLQFKGEMKTKLRFENTALLQNHQIARKYWHIRRPMFFTVQRCGIGRQDMCLSVYCRAFVDPNRAVGVQFNEKYTLKQKTPEEIENFFELFKPKCREATEKSWGKIMPNWNINIPDRPLGLVNDYNDKDKDKVDDKDKAPSSDKGDKDEEPVSKRPPGVYKRSFKYLTIRSDTGNDKYQTKCYIRLVKTGQLVYFHLVQYDLERYTKDEAKADNKEKCVLPEW